MSEDEKCREEEWREWKRRVRKRRRKVEIERRGREQSGIERED